MEGDRRGLEIMGNKYGDCPRLCQVARNNPRLYEKCSALYVTLEHMKQRQDPLTALAERNGNSEHDAGIALFAFDEGMKSFAAKCGARVHNREHKLMLG